jgi:hypothetical protein
MKLYFSNSQIPEVAGLTRNRRRAGSQCALEVYFAEDQSRVFHGVPWLFGGLLGGVLVGAAVVFGSGLSHWKLLVIIACGLAGAAAGTFIAAQFMVEQLRPYLRRVLEERKEEIEKIK